MWKTWQLLREIELATKKSLVLKNNDVISLRYLGDFPSLEEKVATLA